MRVTPSVVVLVMSAAFGLATHSAAQPVASPAIQSVTLQPDTGVLTIMGTGLGADLIVTVDGQSATVLPGATSVRLEVQAPATVLAAPGTYRLTVVDPGRRVGDVFVVASQSSVVGGVTEPGRTHPGSPTGGAAFAERGARSEGPATATLNRPAAGVAPAGVSPALVEGLTNTAVGLNALASNTTGSGNTATGAAALGFNTTGSSNTASGYLALNVNTTGHHNTAAGSFALSHNTGNDNTAIGADALTTNTTGKQNTATGSLALAFNTTGENNTATGFQALRSNTTGTLNTASGMTALDRNTTGYWNTATGVSALFTNSSGTYNTATGVNALAFNTTGDANTASGVDALKSNTTGIYNTASGFNALAFNTDGDANTASGNFALYNNTIGFANTASGLSALQFSTTGAYNVAFGYEAGISATTGSYNVYLGAEVKGTAADTNTIRIGLPYGALGAGTGQNQTFIAGIRGTQLTGNAVQVFIDANGRLGTVPVGGGPGGFLPMSQLQQQVDSQRTRLRDQEAVNAELRARLAKLEGALARVEALLQSVSGRK